MLYCEPWHGQMKVTPDTFVTVQPSCVHTAVRAENASCEMRATRMLAEVVCTSAVPPTVASGEPASTVSVTVRFDHLTTDDGQR